MIYNNVSFDIGSLILIITQDNNYIASKAYKDPSEIGVSLNEFQRKIFRYAPFIESDIFIRLRKLLHEMLELINYYELSIQINDDETKTVEKITPFGNISFENITLYEMTELFKYQLEKLTKEREELNQLIRKHLQSLEIKE